MTTQAEQLEGVSIANGWVIDYKIPKPVDETGGYFSVQYVAKRDEEKCFLKAIDVEKAIFNNGVVEGQFTQVLQEQMNSYEYEKKLLEYCKQHATSKIVLIKDSGIIQQSPTTFPVPYLIFDLADGNVKTYVKFQNDLDFAWKLKSLHDIANGLQQLHNINIIHQDVKPSNILQYKDESKITDLGRSKCLDLNGPYDNILFSGDQTYAPLEILSIFSFLQPLDWYDRNLSMDSYLLGNLMTYYFTGLNMTALIIDRLVPMGISSECLIEERMAYLKHCYNEALEEIRDTIQYEEFADPIVTLIGELCYPDPQKRNDPKTIRRAGSNFALYRCITKLDYLSKKASLKIRKNGSINR